MKNLSLLFRYIQNNRLAEYDRILQKAKDLGYLIVGLREFALKHQRGQKYLILRHDVDHFSPGTKMMFDLEKKHGVKSSFYFRNSTFEPGLMLAIEAYGSEASLHFESVADFVKVRQIRSKEELLKHSDWRERCLNILKADLERFRNLLGVPCLTIASHGEYENELIGVPNNILTEDVRVYEDLGIVLEAYNKEFIEKMGIYISDSPIEINGGYRYGVSPLRALEEGIETIMFLTHPNHWYYTPRQQIKKILKVAVKGEGRRVERFRRI